MYTNIINTIFRNCEHNFLLHVCLVTVVLFLYQVDGHAFRCLGVTYLNPESFQVTLSFVFHRELVLAGCKLYPGKIAVCIHGCG